MNQSEDFTLDDLIKFWKLNSPNFPKLSEFALSLCTSLPSSSSIESSFSVIGTLLIEKRQRLTNLQTESEALISLNRNLL